MRRVIAKLQLDEGLPLDVEQCTDELIRKSRAEDGSISYDLYQNTTDRSAFLFMETYRDQAAVDDHFKSEHLARFLSSIKPYLLKEPEVLIDTID